MLPCHYILVHLICNILVKNMISKKMCFEDDLILQLCCGFFSFLSACYLSLNFEYQGFMIFVYHSCICFSLPFSGHKSSKMF